MTFHPASCCFRLGRLGFRQRVLQLREHLLVVGGLVRVDRERHHHDVAGKRRLLRRRLREQVTVTVR